MSEIGTKLNSVLQKFGDNVPQSIQEPVIKSREDLVKTFDKSKTIQVEDPLPSFSLPDAVGKVQNSSELLAKGPLVIVFYRGEWCPFCNIAIGSMQARLADIQARGASLVAITPENPNGTLSMTEKHGLQFSVLTDLHNEYARKLGFVWKQPEYLRPVFEQHFKHDLPGRNGDDSFELPIPATLLVDKTGKVRNVYNEPDYTKRVDPQVVLDWIDAL